MFHQIHRGGALCGNIPYRTPGGADDGGKRRALITSTSLNQFWATLVRCFGVAGGDMASVFPNLVAISAQDLVSFG